MCRVGEEWGRGSKGERSGVGGAVEMLGREVCFNHNPPCCTLFFLNHLH